MLARERRTVRIYQGDKVDLLKCFAGYSPVVAAAGETRCAAVRDDRWPLTPPRH